MTAYIVLDSLQEIYKIISELCYCENVYPYQFQFKNKLIELEF